MYSYCTSIIFVTFSVVCTCRSTSDGSLLPTHFVTLATTTGCQQTTQNDSKRRKFDPKTTKNYPKTVSTLILFEKHTKTRSSHVKPPPTGSTAPLCRPRPVAAPLPPLRALKLHASRRGATFASQPGYYLGTRTYVEPRMFLIIIQGLTFFFFKCSMRAL